MEKDLLPESESAGQNYNSYNNDVDVDFSEFDLNDNDNAEDDEGFTPISKLIANYGVTLQTVSIYIKNHPDLFEGHLKKTARRTSVDRIGVQLLDDFYITGKSKRVVSLKEYKDLNEKYNDTLKKAALLYQQYQNLMNSNMQLEEKVREADALIEDKAALEKVNSELSAKNAELIEAEHQSMKNINNLTQKVADLEKSASEMDQKLKSSEEENTELESKRASLEEEKQKLQEEIDYLNKHGFSADFAKLKYSYNVGLWGTSICGSEILDSAQGLPESAYLKHCTKEGSEQLRLTFEKGELKAVNDETFDDPIKAIQKVEEIGAAYGIGRDMHVGDTIIGIKGRVGFEAAAPMLIIGAHKFLEKYTLSKWQQYWKDQVANWYGMFLHESQYLEPVMRDIEAMLQESQRNVNGTAILELRPYCFSTVGVESQDDLVKNKFGEYGEMQKGWTAEDAKGFIKVLSTPLRAYYANHKDEENV